MIPGIISTLILLILILVMMSKLELFKLAAGLKKWLYLIFVIKLLGAIALFILYSTYYPVREEADIFKYYDDAIQIYQHPDFNEESFLKLLTDQGQDEEVQSLLSNTRHWDRGDQFLPNDNRMMILFNLFLLPFSNAFYFFHLLFFTFLSFIGGMALFQFLRKKISIPDLPLMLIIHLAPSVLLWTSGLLKESLLMFGLGLLLLGIQNSVHEKKGWSILLTGLAFLFLLGIKTYFLLCLLPALVAYIISQSSQRWMGKKLFILYLSVFSIAAILLLFPLRDLLIREISRVQLAFIESAQAAGAGSYFDLTLVDSLDDLLLQIPEAVYNVWIRPLFPLENNLLSWISALESWAYMMLWVLPLIAFDRNWKDRKQLIYFFASFIILLTLLIGITIPVLGAIVRYRTPLIPFYLVVLFNFVDLNKLLSLKSAS